MKLITKNNLEENLKDFFEYIAKPYIKKEVKTYKKENFVFDENNLNSIIKIDGANHLGAIIFSDGSAMINSSSGVYVYNNGELTAVQMPKSPLDSNKTMSMYDYGNDYGVAFPNGNKVIISEARNPYVKRIYCVKSNGEVVDPGVTHYELGAAPIITEGHIAEFNNKAFVVAEEGSNSVLKVSSDGEVWEDYEIQDFGIGKIGSIYETNGYLFVYGSVGVAVVRVKEYSGALIEEVLENKFIISAASNPEFTNPIITKDGKVFIAYNNSGYYPKKLVRFDSIESLNEPHNIETITFGENISYFKIFYLKKIDKIVLRTNRGAAAERFFLYDETSDTISIIPNTPPFASTDSKFLELTNGDIINYDPFTASTSIAITKDLITYENVNVVESSQLIRNIKQDENGNVYIVTLSDGIKKLEI